MGDRIRILLVDDEKDFLRATQRIIVSLGYEVECAASGNEALNLYKKRRCELLITDLKMPVMDGFELVHKIRAINPEQRIIISTAMHSQVVPWNKRFECSDAPGEGVEMRSVNFLLKPFSKRTLAVAIEKTLEGEMFWAGHDISLKTREGEEEKRRGDDQSASAPLACLYFIDFYRLSKRSVSICVTSSERSGTIFIKDGEIIHVEAGELKGEEALEEILSWARVQIKLSSCPQGLARTVHVPIHSLSLAGRAALGGKSSRNEACAETEEAEKEPAESGNPDDGRQAFEG